MRITNYELMEIFETAAEKFLRYEYELVQMKCNERTLCSQLSHYIRQEMEGNTFFKNKDYHCDIEYSRNCANPTRDYKAKKMLNNSGTNFYADIIIHSYYSSLKPSQKNIFLLIFSFATIFGILF